MNLVATIALGDTRYAQMALNLCLSVKSGNPNQKMLLLCDADCIKGIEELIEKHFDYVVFESCTMESFVEFAFYQKTQLYKTLTKEVPEATNFLFLDADTILLPSKSTDEWFEKHQGRPFTSYCNDIYDFKTKKRKRKDYTFWCEPETVKRILNLPDNKMPQINTSFIYFEKCELAKNYFETVVDIWNNDSIPYIKYRGVKPDELCFNIASAITNILPHQSTYRPVFFQFGSEQQSIAYIFNYYKAFGFAGDRPSSDAFIDFYNEISDYFRQQFGVIATFKYSSTTSFYDPNKLKIKYSKRRTLFRQGEVNESEGGIFNPDSVVSNGVLATIFRKEENYDVYKNIYTTNSAVPFFYLDESNNYDLIPTGFPENVRVEDFRLFNVGNTLWCNHKLVLSLSKNMRDMKTCLSVIAGDRLIYVGVPKLPLQVQRMDINWVFFFEKGYLYCMYSISPYRLFRSSEDSEFKVWEEVELPRTQLNWFHKGQFICNSTNPILIDDSYLVFFHTKSNGVYFHGAALIDAETKRITHYTRNSLDISSSTEGRQKGLLYISGAIYLERINVVRILFGEADSHSGFAEYNCHQLISEIKKYPV